MDVRRPLTGATGVFVSNPLRPYLAPAARGVVLLLCCGAFRTAGAAGARPAARPAYVVCDLTLLFKNAQKKHAFAGIHTRTAMPTIDGKLHRAIFQHAGIPGEPLSEIVYDNLRLPDTAPEESLRLCFTAALDERSFDGVAFIVRVGNSEIYRRVTPAGARIPVRLDLSRFAGKTIALTLAVDPLGNNGHDGAMWVDPRIVIEGRKPSGGISSLPKWWTVRELLSRPEPDRIALYAESGPCVTLVTVQDEYLDLAVQVSRQRQPRTARRRVPLAPPLVVGEGPARDNHTIVKVLNAYGLADVQFLAWPPEVQGGVQVAAAKTRDGATRIAAAPIDAPDVREIRVFDKYGGLQRAFEPRKSLQAPFVIACGDFTAAGPGSEIAVASRSRTPEPVVVFYDLNGKELRIVKMPGPMAVSSLSALHADAVENVIAFDAVAGYAVILNADNGPLRTLQSADLKNCTGLFENAFSAEELIAGKPGDVRSIAAVIGRNGEQKATWDVGRYENLFWVVTPAKTAKPRPGEPHPPNAAMAALQEGRYVKFCRYGHRRMDAESPGYRQPRFDCDDPKWWVGPPIRIPPLGSGPPVMWEPCFTHRAFSSFKPWTRVLDARTGLPRYLMLARTNATDSYVEMGRGFLLSTYAFGLPALEHLYLDRLSAFLVELAVRFREQPERLPSVEPNHENEIPMKIDFTVGDYNPKMVEGFFEYLTRMYGRSIEHLNAVLSTRFSPANGFDAPRWQDRGPWDEYGRNNPYFNAWLNYNRCVVNRRLAEGVREALLAGFPPEIIKFHQIPDAYIRGGDLGFSKVPNRITPIDFALSCGTGYGFTRYGVWYRNKHNVVQGGWSSGHDAMVVGEYQALTPNADEAARQLEYMFNHGVMGVHCMGWRNRRFNETMAEAVKRLIAQDAPRPGAAGGVGQIRAYRRGDRRFNIAVIGAGNQHTGLLKSLTNDGAWEGSVYVAPFKAHIDIDVVTRKQRVDLQRGEMFATGVLDGFDGGSQLEIVFEAASDAGGSMEFQVCHGDQPLPGLTKGIPVGRSARRVRIIHRFQLPTDGVRIRLVGRNGGVVLRNIGIYRHTACIAHVHRGVFEGRRHRGSITFDVLEND